MRRYPGAREVKESIYAGRWEDAAGMLGQALKEKESTAALNDLALVSARLGQDSRMLELIARAEQKPDADIRVKVNHFYLSELARLDRGRGEKALERVKELKRGDPELKPRLSVILRTFNRGALLEEAIASVQHQEFKDWEIVIVNDGGEQQGVEQAVQSLWDKRMVYAYAEHSGVAGAFNVGLRLARGEFIGFLDDDDVFYPEHYSRVVDYFDSHPQAKIVFTNLQRVWLDEHGAVKKQRLDQTRAYHPARRWGISALNFMGLVLRRECLDKVPGFIEGLQGHEDWEFTISLNKHYSFEHLPEPAGEFRFREGLKRSSMGEAAARHKPRNLVLYYHGISPLYSFSLAQNKISRRFLYSLSGFLRDFPQMTECLDLKRLHDDPPYRFFYELGKLLELDGLLPEAHAAYKYAALLAPFKARTWKKMLRTRPK